MECTSWQHLSTGTKAYASQLTKAESTVMAAASQPITMHQNGREALVEACGRMGDVEAGDLSEVGRTAYQ